MRYQGTRLWSLMVRISFRNRPEVVYCIATWKSSEPSASTTLAPCLIASRASICPSTACLTKVFFAQRAAFSSRASRPESTISRALHTRDMEDRDRFEERKYSTSCSRLGSEKLPWEDAGEACPVGDEAMMESTMGL